jgi:hypothetical protein
LTDFRLFITILGPDYLLREVKQIPRVAKFQEWQLRRGRSPVTVNITCRSLQAVFRRALLMGFIDSNPFAHFPRLREDDGISFMDEEELERFLQVVNEWKPPKFRKRPLV